MPHKHKRKNPKLGGDDDGYDLPPNTVAKPLPVGKTSKGKKSAAAPSKSKGSNAYHQDDTPKAFLRLMAVPGKRRRGLDNGNTDPKKKRKSESADSQDAHDQDAAKDVELPTILPGERMTDFAARVNQALPITGLTRKGKKQPGLKERQTRTEKRMQKMQAEWRREDAKRKDQEDEAKDLADEKDAEQWEVSEDVSANSKKSRRNGGTEDDPWAIIKAKRGKRAGLNDVVKAPPNFERLPKETFKFKHGAKVNVDNVPGSAGSLRQREELGETRRSIIESYRKMMEGKRNAQSEKS